MNASILDSFDVHQFCRAFYNGFSTPGEYPDMVLEERKRMLAGLSAEELDWLARKVEVQLVCEVGAMFATSSCGNCKNSDCCNENTEKRFSVEQWVDIEPWKAFLCNSYEPDVRGLFRKTTWLKEIASLLKGIGLPVDDKIVGQCLEQSTRHWFNELKITGPVGLPKESFPGYSSFKKTTIGELSGR